MSFISKVHNWHTHGAPTAVIFPEINVQLIGPGNSQVMNRNLYVTKINVAKYSYT